MKVFMMQFYLATFLISLLASSFTTAYANTCSQIYQNDLLISSKKEAKLFRSAFVLDDLTKRMKTYNKTLEDVKISIFAGESELAINKFVHPFRKVESSYLELERLKKLIRGMDSKKVKLLKQYRKDFNHYSKILGRNFQKYEEASKLLKEIIDSSACSQACKDAIKRIQLETSIFSNEYKQFYSQTINNVARGSKVSFKKVSKSFQENPKAFLVSKRAIFVTNLSRRLHKLFNDKLFLKFLYTSARVSSRIGRALKMKSLYKLFKSGYDVRYFTKHKLMVTKIANSAQSLSKKLALIENELGQIDLDDFLIDFSRVGEAKVQTAFDNIYEHVKNKRGNSTLLKRFDEAKTIGAKIGKVGVTKPRDYTWLVGTMILGGVGYAYFNFEIEGDIPSSVDENEDEELLELTREEVIENGFNTESDEEIIQDYTEAESTVTILEDVIENP